jgi:glycosyltransferase involved in cell wall biosynthesis
MKEGYTLIWSFRNRFDVLKKSIETADSTTPKDVDFCLVDAASSDETIRSLRELCNSIQGRTIRIAESTYRSGLGEAWNWGMMHTDNRYVIFASSDVEFINPTWFTNLLAHHNKTKSQYILIENHAVFLFDKMAIPKMGWFDEEYKPGPHFDPDFMIRASENGVGLTIIPKAGGYRHIGEQANEMVERSTKEIPDRLPMNDFFNEDYFKSKWQCGWPGWRNHIHSEHKPHPPTNISQVKRLIPEIDPHPIYTKKINNN